MHSCRGLDNLRPLLSAKDVRVLIGLTSCTRLEGISKELFSSGNLRVKVVRLDRLALVESESGFGVAVDSDSGVFVEHF